MFKDKYIFVLKIAFVFSVVIFVSNNIAAQEINEVSVEDRGVEDNPEKGHDSLFAETDLKTYRFTLINLFKDIPYTDTILDNKFDYFNPLDTVEDNIVDNGYLGSSAIILGKDYFTSGFDLGFHQYDLYNKTNENFLFYKTNVPVASLFFSPGSSVQEFWTSAKFIKDFKDVNICLDYNRIISAGFYQGQNTKHSSMNFGIWNGRMESKFITFFNFLVNIHQEENNGGVEDTTFYKYSYNSIRENVPVKLNGSVTRLQDYHLVLNEFYKPDFKIFDISPFMHLGLKGSSGFYKFYDQNTSSVFDSIVYKGLLVDDIGLRNFIKYNMYGVFGGLYFLTKNLNNFQLGIDYQHIKYKIEPLDDSNKNQLSLYFKGHYSIWDDKICFLLNSKFFLLDYSNDYFLNTSVVYKSKYFNLNTGIALKNSTPSIIFQQLYLTEKQIYFNHFNNILSNSYFVKAEIPKIGLSFSFEHKDYRNYLYFGSDLLPYQAEEKIILDILKLKENIRFSIFNLNFYGYLFSSNSIKIPVPKFIIRSKLFISPKVYNGNLFLKTGFEFNYWDKYYNYGYNPAIAGFYIQDQVKFDNFMRIDYFISAKIKNFLIFARANNLMSIWDNRVFYKTLDNPQNDFLFRIGVKWTLLN